MPRTKDDSLDPDSTKMLAIPSNARNLQLARSGKSPYPSGTDTPMTLLLSVILGILPLLGIAWTVQSGTITTVDGLFMSLILLALSGILFLNAYWQFRD